VQPLDTGAYLPQPALQELHGLLRAVIVKQIVNPFSRIKRIQRLEALGEFEMLPRSRRVTDKSDANDGMWPRPILLLVHDGITRAKYRDFFPGVVENCALASRIRKVVFDIERKASIGPIHV
jgi:hypothetical protein